MEPGSNPEGPPSKAKYSLATDSVRVARANVEVEVATSREDLPVKTTINNMNAAIEDNIDSLSARVQMTLTLNSLNLVS